jgi:hypothetical protein
MRVKHGASKLLGTETGFDRIFGVALFGDAVWTKQQEMVLRIVGHFEQTANYPTERKERIRRRVVSEKLHPLLAQAFAKLPKAPPFDSFKSAVTRGVLDSLDKLDPQLFRDFVSAIEAAQRVRNDGPVHKLHTMILRLAEHLADEREKTATQMRNGELPMTSKDFTDRLNAESNPHTRFSEPHVRKAAIVLGFSFLDSQTGRPPKLKQ